MEAGEGDRGAVEAVAGFEKWNVESLAVVGDYDVEAFEEGGERLERGGFFAVLAQEELLEFEALRRDPADAREEGESAGAARETRGFRVEKDPALGRDFDAGFENGKQRWGEFGESADIGGAVTEVWWPAAGEEFERAFKRLRRLGVLPVDLRNPAAEELKLLLEKVGHGGLLPLWRRVSFSNMAIFTRRAMVALAAFQGAEEEAWQRFLKWLPTVPPSDNPASLVQLYRSHLLASGRNPAEAERELAAIFKMMRARTDGWQVIFNKIYASPKPGFSTRPNAMLVSAVEGREPGRALDAGMGQGRNSVFLAIKGWDVTGFDVSDEGLAVARRDAGRAGVKVNALLKSYDAFDYGTAQWDLIVITYEPFPLTDADYVRRLTEALRPGGLIVIESFASDATARGRRPVDIDPAELRRAFAEFRIVRFEDAEEVPDWDPKKTRLVRMVAEKRR